MWSPISFRICCIAAMAPALTEAASQAESFALPPHSPSSSGSPQSIQETPSEHTGFLGALVRKDIVLTGSRSLWSSRPLGLVKAVDEPQTPVHLRHAHTGVREPLNCTHRPTMNKRLPDTRDSMGLASANTALDRQLAGKPSPPTYYNEVENGVLPSHRKDVAYPRSDGDVAGAPSDKSERAQSCHAALGRRTEHLMRRLRRLQTRRVVRHVSGQLASFVEHQQRVLGVSCQRRCAEDGSGSCASKRRDLVDLKAELLQSEDVKSLSTAALVNLVRNLESSSVSGKSLQVNRALAALHGGVSPRASVKDVKVARVSATECPEISRVSGFLLNNLRHLESAIDSDATESSSGGESCDEFDGYDDRRCRLTPIHRRAAWKWVVDRGFVASRWTWLQAQVSDLEYRIRQQTETYKKLRASKGAIQIGNPVHSSEGSSSRTVCIQGRHLTPLELKISGIDQKDVPLLVNAVTKEGQHHRSGTVEFPSAGSSTKFSAKAINGFIESGTVTSNGYSTCQSMLTSNVDASMLQRQPVSYTLNQRQGITSQTGVALASHHGISDATCQASRTRPLKNFRKRKVLRTGGLYLINKKASKLSSIQCSCSCQKDMLPCAMCGGRYNNTQTVDTEVMPIMERIGLLDPSFHPVLSFPQDTPVTLHFETLLRSGDVENSSGKTNGPLRKKSRLPSTKSSLVDQARKHSRKLAKNAAQALLSSAKLRKNLDGRHKRRRTSSLERQESGSVRRRKRPTASVTIVRKQRERHHSFSGNSTGSSKPSSPIPSPGPAGSENSNGSTASFHGSSLAGSVHGVGRTPTLPEILRRRRGESAFDINNIVIPYSIAAATRVEKLPYKEILTPKWRIVDDMDSTSLEHDVALVIATEEDEIEDTTDESYILRHDRCEEEEKTRFMGWRTNPHIRIRSRGHRIDYRAEDSRATTPDPLSPQQLDFACQDSSSCSTTGFNSMVVSPPSTPAPYILSEDTQLISGLHRLERKRTMSLSRKDRNSEDVKPPEMEERIVIPYEARTFPLPDNEYLEMLEQSPHLTAMHFPHVEDLGAEAMGLLSPISSPGNSLPDDDPNDPEWTVISSDKVAKQSIVLKFAKR